MYSQSIGGRARKLRVDVDREGWLLSVDIVKTMPAEKLLISLDPSCYRSDGLLVYLLESASSCCIKEAAMYEIPRG